MVEESSSSCNREVRKSSALFLMERTPESTVLCPFSILSGESCFWTSPPFNVRRYSEGLIRKLSSSRLTGKLGGTNGLVMVFESFLD